MWFRCAIFRTLFITLIDSLKPRTHRVVRLWTNEGNTDKSTSQQQFPIINTELSTMKRSVELLSRETTRIDFKFQTASSLTVYVWMIFTASNFDISSSISCDEQVKIFHAGSTETIFRISANYSCWDFWQLWLQIVLEVLFIFNMIYVHWICFQTRQW